MGLRAEKYVKHNVLAHGHSGVWLVRVESQLETLPGGSRIICPGIDGKAHGCDLAVCFFAAGLLAATTDEIWPGPESESSIKGLLRACS